MVFLLGQGEDRDVAIQMVRKHGSVRAALAALEEVERHWDRLLDAVEVHTPDDSFDVLMNRWLLYQTVSCRLWARTGVLPTRRRFWVPRSAAGRGAGCRSPRPELYREHLLRAAARQFKEGDVQHWWHPRSGAGIRSRCSDDLLWLPYAVCRYLTVSGDRGVLDERLPFLEGPPLPPEESEVYDRPAISASRTRSTVIACAPSSAGS